MSVHAKDCALAEKRGPSCTCGADRARMAGPGDVVLKIADQLLGLATTSPHFVIGPVVWKPGEGKGHRTWYFMVGLGAAMGFHSACITGDDRDPLQMIRDDLKVMLIVRRPEERVCIVHDVDSELKFTALVAELWPSPKTRNMRDYAMSAAI